MRDKFLQAEELPYEANINTLKSKISGHGEAIISFRGLNHSDKHIAVSKRVLRELRLLSKRELIFFISASLHGNANNKW